MTTYASARPVFLALALSFALPAAAGGPPAADAKATKSLLLKLTSADGPAVLDGLTRATAMGPAAVRAAPTIEAILARGSTAPITKAAIDALGAIGATSSSAAIRPYLRHRAPEIRHAAARALSSTRGPEAIAAYKEGLRSADAEVRVASAQGLGNLDAREALPELFLALERDITEAAAAIGQACAGDECDMLIAKLGRSPLPLMTSGLDAILFRAKPLPEREIVRIVGLVRALGTADAAKYLAHALERWPQAGSAAAKQAIADAASMPGSGK